MDPTIVPVSLVYLSVPVSTVFWLTYNIPLMVLLSCLLWAAVFRINDINDGGCINVSTVMCIIKMNLFLVPVRYR